MRNTPFSNHIELRKNIPVKKTNTCFLFRLNIEKKCMKYKKLECKSHFFLIKLNTEKIAQNHKNNKKIPLYLVLIKNKKESHKFRTKIHFLIKCRTYMFVYFQFTGPVVTGFLPLHIL